MDGPKVFVCGSKVALNMSLGDNTIGVLLPPLEALAIANQLITAVLEAYPECATGIDSEFCSCPVCRDKHPAPA